MAITARYGWAASPDALNRGDVRWSPKGKIEMFAECSGPDPIEILEDGRSRWYRRPGSDWETKRPQAMQPVLEMETSQLGLF